MVGYQASCGGHRTDIFGDQKAALAAGRSQHLVVGSAAQVVATDHSRGVEPVLRQLLGQPDGVVFIEQQG
jgi:hypothetical protein